MTTDVKSEDFSRLSRDLDDAASEAATATLRQIASSVTAAMPGASAGQTMSDAVSHFDENLRLFADALTSDSEAAAKNHASFVATDDHGARAFAPAAFDAVADSLEYGK